MTEVIDVPRELRSWVEYPEQPKGELDLLLAYTADLIDACVPFLSIGETPAACIARNRKDADAVLTLLANEKRTTQEQRAQILHLVQFHPKYGTAEWCGTCLPKGLQRCACACTFPDCPHPDVTECGRDTEPACLCNEYGEGRLVCPLHRPEASVEHLDDCAKTRLGLECDCKPVLNT